MRPEKIDNILYKAQAFLVILSVLLVAILLSRQTVDSAILKTTWSIVLTYIMFFILILRYSINKSAATFSPIKVIILLFFAWQIINSIFISPFTKHSLSYSFIFLSYIIVFFVVSDIARKHEFRLLFFNFFIVLSGILITYGVMQRFGYDLFQWEKASSARRILSTFGNPIFFANYLLLLICFLYVAFFKNIFEAIKLKEERSYLHYFTFIALFFIIHFFFGFLAMRIARMTGGFARDHVKILMFLLLAFYFLVNYFLIKKRAYIVIFSLSMIIGAFVCLLFTLSRGAWFGFIPMLLCLLAWTLFYLKKHVFPNLPLKRIIVFSLIAIGVLILITYPFIPKDIKMRFKELNFQSRTAQVRLTLWKGAMKMIRKSPVTGLGSGAFQLNFPTYRPNYYQTKTVSHNTINAHSEFLQIAANKGLIGLLLFMSLLFLVIFKSFFLLHKIKDFDDFFFLLAITSSIIAIFTHNMVCVTMRFTSTGFMFYVFLGMYHGLFNSYTNKKDIVMGTKRSIFYALIVIIFILGLPSFISYTDKLYQKDYFVRFGMLSEEAKSIMNSEHKNVENTFKQARKDEGMNVKILENLLKFDRFWYAQRAFTMSKYEKNVIKKFFMQLERQYKRQEEKIEIRILKKRASGFIDRSLKSPAEIQELLSGLKGIFEKDFENTRFNRKKELLLPLYNWIHYLYECSRTEFSTKLNNSVQLFQRKQLKFSDIEDVYSEYLKFYDVLFDSYSTKSVLYYNMAIFTDHYTYDAHYKKASAYFDLDDFEGALASYLTLKKSAPYYTQLQYNLGIVYKKLFSLHKEEEYLELSTKNLEISRKLNPYFINTRMMLAANYNEMKMEKEFLSEYEFANTYMKEQFFKILSNPASIYIRREDMVRFFQLMLSTGDKLNRPELIDDLNEVLDRIRATKDDTNRKDIQEKEMTLNILNALESNILRYIGTKTSTIHRD